MVHHCKVLFVYCVFYSSVCTAMVGHLVCVYDVIIQRHNNRRFKAQDPMYTQKIMTCAHRRGLALPSINYTCKCNIYFCTYKVKM